MSCLSLQVVFDYKICLLLTIGIWGAFLASRDFLVKIVLVENKHIELKRLRTYYMNIELVFSIYDLYYSGVQ